MRTYISSYKTYSGLLDIPSTNTLHTVYAQGESNSHYYSLCKRNTRLWREDSFLAFHNNRLFGYKTSYIVS